jgi:hypothetical protein
MVVAPGALDNHPGRTLIDAPAPPTNHEGMTKLAIVTGATNGIGKEIANLELDRLCSAMMGVGA